MYCCHNTDPELVRWALVRNEQQPSRPIEEFYAYVTCGFVPKSDSSTDLTFLQDPPEEKLQVKCPEVKEN